MSARPLKSDQVNYLIWRYLQESGHGQTAARLQRDWGRAEPEKLPFAQYIGTHALVHLLQKGLRYHELETSLDQNGEPRPSAYFWGPDTRPSSPPAGATAASHLVPGNNDDDAASDTSRKHPRDGLANGAAENLPPPTAKRSRRAKDAGVNGARSSRAAAAEGMDVDSTAEATPKREPGTQTSTRATSPSTQAPQATSDVEMDVDTTTSAKATTISPRRGAPALKAEEGAEGSATDAPPAGATPGESPAPVVLVPTLEHGASVGVQSEKVADLAPDTAVLRVPGSNVTHALWSPRDPTLLAAAGDALCRLWTIPTTEAARADPGSDGQRTLQPSGTVELHDAADGFYVTSMAWSPDGESIAVAKHPSSPGSTGMISIYDKAGVPLDELPGGQELVLNLLWNPSGTLLLGISHSGDDSTVMVWDTEAARAIEPLQVKHTIADVAWTDNRAFLVCANGLVASSSVQATRIEALDVRSDVRKEDWSRIEHDLHTQTTVVAADGPTGVLGCIGPDRRWSDTVAHHAEITGLVFQPLTNPSAVRTNPSIRRLVATAATDGTVKVWNARKPFELVHTLELGKTNPALAISFTPDGYLVAAASADKILFWNADAGGPPKASWSGSSFETQVNGTHINGNGHAENGDVDMKDGEDVEIIPSLSWDADGGKLAYGAKSQIAVISFRR